MAGLQRSAVSFRRQGSSGLVWDDKLIQAELNKANQKEGEEQSEEQREQDKIIKASSRTVDQPISSSSTTLERSRSNGGGRGYRTGRVSPAIEPPSPKVSACGFCSAFAKSPKKGQRNKPGQHRSR